MTTEGGWENYLSFETVGTGAAQRLTYRKFMQVGPSSMGLVVLVTLPEFQPAR